MGARVIIACQPDSKLAKTGAENNIDIRTVKMENSASPFTIYSLLKIIKDENVNLVCTHSGKDSMLGAIAGRLSRIKPVIVRTRHLALPITSRITYSLFPHKVVTVSEYVRKYLVKEKRIPANKVVSIPTGVDLERFAPDTVNAVPREELSIPNDVPVVGTIAIFRRKKGHHTLLDAIPLVLKKIPNARFVFVGDGPQRENIEKKLSELGLAGNVKLLGLRKDIPEILNTIDLFVLPTLQEALGTSFLEAMAMRRPVIGTRVGGVPEVVKDGVSGILVEPEDPVALSDAIMGLLNDKGQMKRMGDAGRRIVEEKYSIDVMVRSLFNFYTSLVSEAGV
ncbi:MAG: hypothetical protein A3J81_03075 [Nitrospirae bacterium RIFOXYB2_FULL_43_5]|nr:MAG: hypothetical protein A3J81_03075 [Nitrospirae bacterium RIFOXYB2_FULL_43_5]